MSKFIASVVLFLTFFFLGIYEVSACKCRGRKQDDKNYQPCLAFWTADAVFIGLAEKISVENYEMKVSFSVEKSIRGNNGNTVDIFTATNPNKCGYPFKEGERYFVYARRDQAGKLTEVLCGPTAPLEKAKNDLEYLKDIESGKSGKRLYGYVRENRRESYKTEVSFVPLAGIEITIKGKKNTFKTQTDESGFYLFRDMPPDDYRVTANLPGSLREIAHREDLPEYNAVIRADSYSCGNKNFIVTSQGSVRGKIVDALGKLPPQQLLSLIPLDETAKPTQAGVFQEIWANRQTGEYFFNAVPEGKYLLAINPKNCPYPTNGYGTMFFPGVATASEAKIITVKSYERLEIEDFRLLPPLKERWFSGVVLSADKTPFDGASVYLADSGKSGCSSFTAETRTDAQGRFRLKGYEGYRYSIRAFSVGKNTRNTTSKPHSKPFEIPLNGGSDSIELILDLPN